MNQNPFRVTRYPHGTFSWVDMSSTDSAASKAFLSELMGWSYRRYPPRRGRA